MKTFYVVFFSVLSLCIASAVEDSLPSEVKEGLKVTKIDAANDLPAAEKNTATRALCGAFIICERKGSSSDAYLYETRVKNTTVFTKSVSTCTRKLVKGTTGGTSYLNHAQLFTGEKFNTNYYFFEYIYECQSSGSVSVIYRNSSGQEFTVYTCNPSFEAHAVHFGL